MTPTFTVLIGSIGRPSLRFTLDAVARQDRHPGDQVIIGLDAFEQSPEDIADRQALVASYGEGFLSIVYDAGYHWLGVEQINRILQTVPITGSHIFTLGDDDIFVDGAYARLRPICAEAPDRPVLYRFLSPPTTPDGRPWRAILWDQPRLARSRISGCCIAAPVAAVGLMSTRRYVEHDYDWIVEICRTAQQPLIWLDDVLVIARPEASVDGDVWHRGLWRCSRCETWDFLEEWDQPHCPACQAPRLVEASPS